MRCHGLLLALLLMPASASADALRVGWGRHNAPPYAIVTGDVLTGGIIHDIGLSLAQRLAVDARFIEVPRTRYEEQLRAGALDLACIFNPAWMKNPDAFAWSPPLFSESDIVVQAAGTQPWNDSAQLAGKRVGTILGYRYPSIDALFAAGVILRDDAADLDSNLQRLDIGRLDAVIDANIPVYYWLLHHGGMQRHPIATFVVSRHDVYCAISAKIPGGPARVQAAFRRMTADGSLRETLARYLSPE